MNRSTYRFTLDLQKHRSQMSVAVFARDSAVRFYISLTDGGNRYLIEEGGKAVFYGKRPDDTPLCHNCMIDDTGRVIYDFNDQTAAIEGITQCQIRIYGKDGELITAPRFIIVADERLVSDADIEKLEDSPLAALDAIIFAENDRVSAETERVNSESARAEAETERVSNETARIEAEAERVSNEITRIKAVNDHEKRITNLEKKVSPSFFETDESIAYRKSVPTDACPYAQVNSVGGMSYKTVNLINDTNTYPKIVGGVTIDYKDGVYTLNGTCTSNVGHTLQAELYLPSGTYCLMTNTTKAIDSAHYLVMVNSADSSQRFYVSNNAVNGFSIATFTSATFKVSIQVLPDVVYDNFVFAPMIALSDTTVPFSTYFEGLRHSKVTELVSRGAQIIPYPYVNTSMTKHGITYTDNGDGTITANGTAPASTSFIFANTLPLLDGQTYYVKDCTLSYKDSGGVTKLDAGKQVLWKSEYEMQLLYLYVAKGTIYDNRIIKPILSLEDVEYKPYHAEPIDTLEIPEAVQALEGWGLGIDAEYNNHIEKRGDKWIYRQEVYEEILDGVTKKVVYMGQSGAGIYYGTIWLDMFSVGGTNLIASHFDTARPNGQAGHIRTDRTQLIMYNYDQTITTADAWNEWLQNNPVTIVYALAEPIETDITHLFTRDNFLAVEGGGTITAKNDYGNAVPSSITYMLKESESV